MAVGPLLATVVKYCHIHTVCTVCHTAGMVTVMDGPETGPFNIGNPTEFTMLELAQMVQQVVNPDVKIVYKENTADDPSRRKPDITKVALAPVLQNLLTVLIFSLWSCPFSQNSELQEPRKICCQGCLCADCMVAYESLAGAGQDNTRLGAGSALERRPGTDGRRLCSSAW